MNNKHISIRVLSTKRMCWLRIPWYLRINRTTSGESTNPQGCGTRNSLETGELKPNNFPHHWHFRCQKKWWHPCFIQPNVNQNKLFFHTDHEKNNITWHHQRYRISTPHTPFTRRHLLQIVLNGNGYASGFMVDTDNMIPNWYWEKIEIGMLKVHQPEFRIGEFAITEFIQKYIQFVVMSQEGPEGHSCHTPCGITRTGPFFHPTCWGLVFNHVSHRPVRHCGKPILTPSLWVHWQVGAL